MTANSDPTTFTMLILGVSTFVLIMLLPSLLELKRPKDAGPRKILEESALSQLGVGLVSLEGNDEKVPKDLALVKRIADVIAVLPNLEA